MKKQIIRLTENDLYQIVENSVRKILRESVRNYDYLSLVSSFTPDNSQQCDEDMADYDYLCEKYKDGDYDAIMNHMLQWDDGGSVSDTYKEIDKYERILKETDTHILTVCPSKYFGWTGDAFFLYRKDFEE